MTGEYDIISHRQADTSELSSPVEAQVPLAHQVGGVAGLAEPLGQRVHVRGQAAGLTGPDDGMLKPRVDLISENERTDEVSRCVLSLSIKVKRPLPSKILLQPSRDVNQIKV